MANETDTLPQDFYEAVHEIACNVGTEEYAPVVLDYCERLTARVQELERENGELRGIIGKLQAIIHRWLPKVRAGDHPLNNQIGDDAFALMGYADDNQPELGEQVFVRMERAEAELAALRAFARDIMRAWPEGDVDGGELQDAALRHGLLERAEPTQEERDEWGLCEGDDWYRRTALLLPLDDEAKS